MKTLKKEEISLLYSEENKAKNFTINPISIISASLKTGTVGFFIVLFLIVITKLLYLSIITHKLFTININDLIISFWGFIILSFIAFASRIKNIN